MADTDISNPQQLSDLLQKHHFYTQKKFGQNFLIDNSVVMASIEAAHLEPTDIVVEIGAGTGVLTQQLAGKARFVHVFEIDSSLQPLLTETLAGLLNVEIHFQDFRNIDLLQILNQVQDDKSGHESIPDLLTTNYKIVSNLPYNAGTHILGQLIQLPHPPQSITVLLQKEVAQKITAAPPHATYLSNFISLYGQAQIIKIVHPGSFFPSPKVDSAILHIVHHPASDTLPSPAFSRFLHRGFANPRKKINKAFTVADLNRAGIDPNLRPENVRLEEWKKLFEMMHDGI